MVEILLIEDNPYEAELAIRTLKKSNLTNNLHHIDDGAEALDFIFEQGRYAGTGRSNPKLILLDIKLPKVDGIEILKQLKANEKTKTIPVVILTSSKESQDIKACYELGANTYIQKPVDFDGLIAATKRLKEYWFEIAILPKDAT